MYYMLTSTNIQVDASRYETFYKRKIVFKEPLYHAKSYGSGALVGHTKIQGVVSPNAEIIVWERNTLQLRARVYSLADGSFEVPDLNPEDEYLVIFREESGTWRPVVYDKVTANCT